MHLSGFLSSAVQIGQITSPDYFLELFWISFAIYDIHNRHDYLMFVAATQEFHFLVTKSLPLLESRQEPVQTT